MTNTPTEDPDYLWDGSGEPDPEVVRLESLLAPLAAPRNGAGAAAAPDRARAPRDAVGRARAVRGRGAAARRGGRLVRVRDGPQRMVRPEPRGSAGRGRIAAARRPGRRRAGWKDGPPPRRRVAGHRRRVARADCRRPDRPRGRGAEHADAARRGARARASPVARRAARSTRESGRRRRFFYVNTPSAVAIDLGCEYTLQVDDAGAGVIRVTTGWVEFENDGRESFMPEGAMCATRPGVGPGTPRYEDAPSGYGEALTILDFERPDDSRRAAALDLVLSTARRRDALTLWHLLSRGTPAERAPGLRPPGHAGASAARRDARSRRRRRPRRARSLVGFARAADRRVVEAPEEEILIANAARARPVLLSVEDSCQP